MGIYLQLDRGFINQTTMVALFVGEHHELNPMRWRKIEGHPIKRSIIMDGWLGPKSAITSNWAENTNISFFLKGILSKTFEYTLVIQHSYGKWMNMVPLQIIYLLTVINVHNKLFDYQRVAIQCQPGNTSKLSSEGIYFPSTLVPSMRNLDVERNNPRECWLEHGWWFVHRIYPPHI